MSGIFTVPDTTTVATTERLPLTFDFTANVQVGDLIVSPTSLYTAWDNSTITPTDPPTLTVTNIVASPTPTTTTFSVTSGTGVNLQIGALLGIGRSITVGTQLGIVSAISGDAITVSPPLASVPTAGQTVYANAVQQIVRGSQLTAKQTVRLDVTVTLNPSKIITSSTDLKTPY